MWPPLQLPSWPVIWFQGHLDLDDRWREAPVATVLAFHVFGRHHTNDGHHLMAHSCVGIVTDWIVEESAVVHDPIGAAPCDTIAWHFDDGVRRCTSICQNRCCTKFQPSEMKSIYCQRMHAKTRVNFNDCSLTHCQKLKSQHLWKVSCRFCFCFGLYFSTKYAVSMTLASVFGLTCLVPVSKQILNAETWFQFSKCLTRSCFG